MVPDSATPSPSVTASSFSPTSTNTQTPTQPAPTPVPLPARLAVLTSRARLMRGGSAQEIQQAQSADVQAIDEIEIVAPGGQGEQSYSLLQFPGLVNVELLGATNLSLVAASQGVEGPPEITVALTQGHLFVHLSEQEFSSFTVRTSQATIRALTSGAEFDVCQTEELTCVMVKRGVVEIVAKDNRELVRAGSAAVALNDSAEPSLICAPIPPFLAWEERFRTSADATSLQQEIDALPQQACPVAASGFPLNARILYRDEFSSASTGWNRGQFDQFTAGYVRGDGGRRYYQVQIQGAQAQFLAFMPNGRDYGDVNITLQTRTETVGKGDFRYGLVFRRSGDQYYAFVVSPVTQAWVFLKSSSTGLQILKEGAAERLRGLNEQDTLQVEAYGSTFLLFINGRLIDSVSDPDYPSGDVGLFVESMENPDAFVNFNSLTVWDVPALVFGRTQGENCFNGVDDDGDGAIDLADTRCKRFDIVTYPTVPPLPTITPRPTRTPRPTNTPKPTGTVGATKTPPPTNTVRPSRTPTPEPTNTRRPTRTPTPEPTNTRRPTRTPTPEPTDPPKPTKTPVTPYP